MSDNDNQLDAMLVETEDTSAAVEEPQADIMAEVDETGAADAEPAGTRPEEKKAEDTPTGDAPEETKTNDTVPLRTFIEMRRDLHQRLREVEDQLATKTETPTEAPADEDDDDETPLTKADLRRIESERRQAAEVQTQEQQVQRVRQALAKADPDQIRLLHLAEQHLSARDRQSISTADDVLETALTLAKNRIEVFGSDAELEWLTGLAPPATVQPKPKPTSQAKAKQPPAAVKPTGPESPGRDDDDMAPNRRALLDHMFG